MMQNFLSLSLFNKLYIFRHAGIQTPSQPEGSGEQGLDQTGGWDQWGLNRSRLPDRPPGPLQPLCGAHGGGGGEGGV